MCTGFNDFIDMTILKKIYKILGHNAFFPGITQWLLEIKYSVKTAQWNGWMSDLINIMQPLISNVSVSIWIMISIPLSMGSNNYLCTPEANKNVTNLNRMRKKLGYKIWGNWIKNASNKEICWMVHRNKYCYLWLGTLNSIFHWNSKLRFHNHDSDLCFLIFICRYRQSFMHVFFRSKHSTWD